MQGFQATIFRAIPFSLWRCKTIALMKLQVIANALGSALRSLVDINGPVHADQ